MDRRTLLQGLLALPVVSAFDGCPNTAPAPKSGSAKLRVVLGGAFGLVLQQDRGWGVRAFTPRDSGGRHDLTVVAHDVDRHDPEEKQSRNFTLLSSGLKETKARFPEVDEALCDFRASTSKWCQEDYWLTIDLPAPQRISFMGPMTPVRFGDPEKDGCMPPNHVLEYDVIDPRLVRLEEQGRGVLRPAGCEQLEERYEEGCKKVEEQNPRPKDDAEHKDAAQGMCTGKEAYNSFCRRGDLTFFFGVGLGKIRPKGDQPDVHPVLFFKRILDSFPELKNLEIHSIGRQGDPCKHACSDGRNHGEMGLYDTTPTGRLIEAAFVYDCEVTGPVVFFQSPPQSK